MERRNPTNRKAFTEDKAVMDTAGDAARAKLSTCQRGYYTDPFISHFSKGILSSYRTRMEEGSYSIEPIIRRGTFARTCVMDHSITSFLSLLSSNCHRIDTPTHHHRLAAAQIVNVGCGKDTAYLRLRTGHLLTKHHQQTPVWLSLENSMQLRWYDIDFPLVIQSKANLLRTCHEFPCTVTEDSTHSSSFYIHPHIPSNTMNMSQHYIHHHSTDNQHRNIESCPYHLVSFDLDQSPHDLFQLLIDKHAFNTSIPTLFLFECVHMYLHGMTLLITFSLSKKIITVFYFINNICLSTSLFQRILVYNYSILCPQYVNILFLHSMIQFYLMILLEK